MIQQYPKMHSGVQTITKYGQVQVGSVPVPSVYRVTSKVAPNTSLATHTFLLIRNANGITERVIEGKAEKLINGSEEYYGYGRLIGRIGSTKAELGPITAPSLETVHNPYGDSMAGFLQFKNKILMEFNKFQYQSRDYGIPYYPVPEEKPGSGNSNSLIGSILRNSGANVVSPYSSAFGWETDVIR